MNPEYLFIAAFAGIALFFAWRLFRSGSITGALLGGSIERECGEVSLDGGPLQSQKVKVYAMKSPSGERFVGVSLVAKAPMSASMKPFKLTSAQAGSSTLTRPPGAVPSTANAIARR